MLGLPSFGMDAVVEFDFDDVVATVQHFDSRANRDDAEEAVQQGVERLLKRGEPLVAAYVVNKARSALGNIVRRAERRNSSLDAFAESDVDNAPIEFAIEEIDFDAHLELRRAAENPVLRRRLEAARCGTPVIKRRGRFHHATRYPSEVVEEARRLRRQGGHSYQQIARRVGASQGIVEYWLTQPFVRGGDTEGWSRELIIEAIRAFAREEGRRPTERDLRIRRDPRLPSHGTVERHFKNWGEALRLAGLDKREYQRARGSASGKWTVAYVFKAFRAFVDRHGHWPNTAEFRAKGNGLPSYAVIERLFNTTSIAKIRALAEAN